MTATVGLARLPCQGFRAVSGGRGPWRAPRRDSAEGSPPRRTRASCRGRPDSTRRAAPARGHPRPARVAPRAGGTRRNRRGAGGPRSGPSARAAARPRDGRRRTGPPPPRAGRRKLLYVYPATSTGAFATWAGRHAGKPSAPVARNFLFTPVRREWGFVPRSEGCRELDLPERGPPAVGHSTGRNELRNELIGIRNCLENGGLDGT